MLKHMIHRGEESARLISPTEQMAVSRVSCRRDRDRKGRHQCPLLAAQGFGRALGVSFLFVRDENAAATVGKEALTRSSP